jgi:TrmH family RNA methyltransferase
MTVQALDRLLVVLHRPQNIQNIGGVVRAMKNMGVQQLRLVAPPPFEPAQISALAHRSADLLAATRSYATLDAALADAVYVVGTTDHQQGQHAIQSDVRALAPRLLEQTMHGPVALLFGAEDNGLDLAALDRCNLLLRLPTDPAYPSLNLAQAVLLLLYELRMAAGGPAASPPAPTTAPPTPHPDTAPAAEVATLCQLWEDALHTLDFFEGRNPPTLLRPLRALMQRARPTHREAALLMAIARAISKRVQREPPAGRSGR